MPNLMLKKLLDAREFRALQQAATEIALDAQLPADQRAEAYWYACSGAHRQDNYYAATKLAEAGLALAESSGDLDLNARLHFKLGGLYIWVGDLVQAEEHLRCFLALAPATQREVTRLSGMAHYNLGLIHIHRHDYAAAVATLQEAAEGLAQAGLTAASAQARLDMVWSHLRLQQLEAAMQQLTEAEALLQQEPDANEQLHLLCCQAYYHRLRGDLRSASACCEKVLAPGRTNTNPHYLAGAAWNAGEVALASGRLEEASIFADLAQQYAMVQLYPLLLNLVSDLRRRIREQARAV